MHRWSSACAGLNRILAGVVTAILLTAGAAAVPASASTTIGSFAVAPSSTQAGGHPDLAVSFSLDSSQGAEAAKTTTLELPPGVQIEPDMAVRCRSANFDAMECSPAAQVGLVTVRGRYEGEADYLFGTAPVYDVEATPGNFGRLGFVIPTIEAPVIASLTLGQASDYALRVQLEDLPQTATIAGIKLNLWGVPAAASHDQERFPGGSPGCPGLEDTSCQTGPPVPSPLVPMPFTLSPSACSGPLSAGLAVRTYQDPGSPSFAETAYPDTSGCNQLAFDPSFALTPTTTAGYAPSGLDIDFRDPQPQSPSTPSPSELRYVEAWLPEAMGLNPDFPELDVCGEAEAALGTEQPPRCPEASSVGIASVSLASLGEPLIGAIYLAEAGEEPALLLALSGDRIELNLLGELWEDPGTGQLGIGLGEQPQLPIIQYQLHFSAGPHALFQTPVHCDTYVSEATFVPWDDQLPELFGEWPFEVDTGPGGSPCIGNAHSVALSLAPSAIPVGGSSSAVASVRVIDANGTGIPAEDVTITSSDPGQKVGEVTDNEDGTYTVRLTGATKPGPVTITATDRSATPNISASATLVETAPAPSVSTRRPVVAFRKKPPRKGTHRKVRFDFKVDKPGAVFECRLDRSRFRRCKPPVVLRRLRFGRHRFAVRASIGGLAGGPIVWHFRIVRRHRHRHHHRHIRR